MIPVGALTARAFVGLLSLLVVLAASLFIPAGTLDYWQAWVFLVVFSVSVVAITVYLIGNDPRLLERRLNAGPSAEQETGQKIVQSVAAVAFVAFFVISALDHRLTWSLVPLPLVALGDVLVVLGLFIVFLVFKENTYTSAIIEVGAGQRVVSTGPYAVVRHPMYGGALVMLLGIPLALGSWWGLLAMIPISAAIVGRILGEEDFLTKSLPGYAEYRNSVRYRLIPLIW